MSKQVKSPLSPEAEPPPLVLSSERDESRFAPPRSLADIPGLGPIRVRALQKAGLGTLKALREASLETLAAVPGITSAKAVHIQHYLTPFLDLPDEEEGEATSPTLEGSRLASEPIRAPFVEAAQAMGKATELFLSRQAGEFRGPLLRELSRFAHCANQLTAGKVVLAEKEKERIAKLLRRITEELTVSLSLPELDRKAQSRLTDRLAEVSRRLSG